MSHVPYYKAGLLIFNLSCGFAIALEIFVLFHCVPRGPRIREKGTLPALTLRRYHKVTTSHVCPPPLLYESQSVC